MYKMKHSRSIIAGMVATIIGILCTFFLFMHTVTVEPDEVAVIVDKPYLPGFHSGARDEVLTDGRILLFRTSSAIIMKTSPQIKRVPFNDLASKDNALLDFEASIQYKITNPKELSKFGASNWFSANIERQFMAIVRETVKEYSLTQMMSDVNATVKVDNAITEKLIALVAEQKLPIMVMGVSLGRAKPDAVVLEEMNKTVAAQQRQLTHKADEAAHRDRKDAENARAAADKEYRTQLGIAEQSFVELEKTRMMAEACIKATTCVVGGAVVSK